MVIRELCPDESKLWLRLRERLWPDAPKDELEREQEEILSDPSRNVVLVSETPTGQLAGFVELRIRDWAEGCETRTVGYIEGWYVEPEYRRAGVGRLLIGAAERWAFDRGCNEMGSDAELNNEISHRAHRALGYEEVARLVCFSKKLTP